MGLTGSVYFLFQFTTRESKDGSHRVNIFDDTAGFQAKRTQLLQQQRELEKRRNEEEDYFVKTHR